MRGRIRGLSCHAVEPLSTGWTLAASAAGAVTDPSGLRDAGLEWTPAIVPGTVAAALRATGEWSLGEPARRFDAEDWWYRVTFSRPAAESDTHHWLSFEGLATLSEAWLNGRPLFSSRGMFTSHERLVDGLLAEQNELVLCFRSLDGALALKRPRPRWRAPMVENQQLRWFRTTLLGRTPGWSPPAAAVGPWGAIRIEHRRVLHVHDLRIDTDQGGRLVLDCAIEPLDGTVVQRGEVELSRDGRAFRAPFTLTAGGSRYRAETIVPDVALWWPHTHGDPALYDARLRFTTDRGEVVADVGPIGFRSITVDRADGGFAVRVNDTPIFCRGACWTPIDPVSLISPPDALDAAFDQVVAAGMNMLRVGGTMVYESDAFLDHCDRRGVLLWQDLMFANMDYPADDEIFRAEVETEVRQLLARLQGRPSLAVVCGNSEGEQQAAMWGAPRERWPAPLFHAVIPPLVESALSGIPYSPSSTHGGAFPHQSNAGPSSYYGVGAYLRSLEDARRAEVRFATECLAFANVPDHETLARISAGSDLKVHESAWRERAPRDLGAGWDFDDVRDHYVRLLFNVDPAGLRYEDHERYLALGRVATGAVMESTMIEWRRARSATRGALIWFLRDLWRGAGWGVVDSDGRPKAAWHFARRAMQPVVIGLTDEGTNGIAVHVVNDGPQSLNATVELALFRAGEVSVGHASQPVVVPARGALERNAVEWFEGFSDLNHAYRFGPPGHDVVVATLRDDRGVELSRAFHFVGGWPATRELDIGLQCTCVPTGDGAFELVVRTRRFALAVNVRGGTLAADDDHFHLVPGEERRLRLSLRPGTALAAHPTVTVQALNSERSVMVSVA